MEKNTKRKSTEAPNELELFVCFFFTVILTHPMYLRLLKVSYIDPNHINRLEKFYPVSHF